MEPTEFTLYARFAPNFTKDMVPGALCELFDKQALTAFNLHHAPGSDPWWNTQALELTAGVGVLESGTIKQGDFMPWQISSYAYRTPNRTILLLYFPIHSEHDDPDITWSLAKSVARAASKLDCFDYIALTATGDLPDDQEAEVSDTDLESEIPAVLAPWLFIGNVLKPRNRDFLDDLNQLDNKPIVKHNNGIELNLIEKYNSDISENIISLFEKNFGEQLSSVHRKLP